MIMDYNKVIIDDGIFTKIYKNHVNLMFNQMLLFSSFLKFVLQRKETKKRNDFFFKNHAPIGYP